MKNPADSGTWVSLNKWVDEWLALKDGEACKWHPYCLHHQTHPCEGCGRIGGRKFTSKEEDTKVDNGAKETEREIRQIERRAVTQFAGYLSGLPNIWTPDRDVYELMEAVESFFQVSEPTERVSVFASNADAVIEQGIRAGTRNQLVVEESTEAPCEVCGRIAHAPDCQAAYQPTEAPEPDGWVLLNDDGSVYRNLCMTREEARLYAGSDSTPILPVYIGEADHAPDILGVREKADKLCRYILAKLNPRGYPKIHAAAKELSDALRSTEAPSNLPPIRAGEPVDLEETLADIMHAIVHCDDEDIGNGRCSCAQIIYEKLAEVAVVALAFCQH